MMKSRRLFWRYVLWIICVIWSYIHPNACTKHNFHWTLDNTHANMVCENAAIGNAHVSSVTRCGEVCAKTLHCTAFTYAKSMSPNNCFLMNGVPLQQDGCTPSILDRKQFVRKEEVFSCHADDNLYHTIMLSHGDSFSYRVSQTTKTAAGAQTDCVSSGGSLAKVSTLARLELIRKLTQCPGFDTAPFFWVDGSNLNAADFKAPDAWTFRDGTPVNMIPAVFWSTGYPNKAHLDHCIAVDRAKSMTFNDKTCSDTFFAICEKP